MSKTVESKVVEMRFDNKQFESGAKETMGTLNKLKEALKLPDSSKALEGIDKAAKGVSLDGLSAGIDALNKRFSTLGIVGMRVIENITDGLMNKLNTAVNFVTNSIVSGGIKRAMNIENAHFQLQALLKDEGKVQAVMADAMESVDGTAYAYDEAAKAASQFAASGLQSGEEMLGALKGITGVAAMTNSSFEDIARIFTTIAGNGRLMGDQLLQLSGRGLNAASTLVDYFREVRGESDITEATVRDMVSHGKISFKDFSDAMTWAFGESAKRANETFTGSLSNMKSALARIGAGFISPLVEQNGEIVQLFNALRIKINDVKAALVFDEQRSAISGLAEVTGLTNDELSDMFKTIKSNGKVTNKDLDTLTKKGAKATDALTKYVNGVTNGTIRASYAISSALEELTGGTEVSTADIRRFVEEGKIDLSMFTSAMEKEFGNEKVLSKQFTDWFLDHIHMVVNAINAADMTKPMAIFYYWVESVKNVTRGLLSVLNPIAKAFAEIFLSFSADDVISFSDAIETLTSKMKLSERGSKNLHDAAQGLFSVVKLLIDGFFDLVSVIVPINKPIIEAGGGFLDLAGSMGRALTSFTETIRSCKLLRKAFEMVSYGFSIVADEVTNLIKMAKKLISTVSDMEISTKLINAVTEAFKRLSTKATPYIKDFVNGAKTLFKSLFNLEDINLDQILIDITGVFSNLSWEIKHFSLSTVVDAFETLKNKVSEFVKMLTSSEGLSTFVKNAKEFGEELREAFSFENIIERLEKIMSVFGRFFNWVRDNLGPAFAEFNFGSTVAAAGGLGIVYALIKASKAFEKVASSIKSIPNILNSFKGAIDAYQKDLNASALLKVSAAIAVLAGALVLLSFTDTDRLLKAAVALTLVGGTLMAGVTAILNALNKGKEANNALTAFMTGLGNSISNVSKSFGKSLEIKAWGSTIKKFAESIAIIAVSIIALGIMYKKDKEALMAGVELVKTIGIALVGIMAGMSVLGAILKGDAMKSFSKAALGVLSLSLSLTMCINALNKLFKMEFPPDWKFKVEVLAGMLAGLGVLAVAIGAASRIAGQNKMSSTMILSVAALLMTTVIALNKLFKMEFPPDWAEKVTILELIFASFGALMLVLGASSRLAGGSIKAAGTILAMCVFIGTIVAALMVLTVVPTEKLIKGATALGVVLTTLGVALFGAGKITSPDTYKSVVAMALIVGSITASLAVLSMVPFDKLLKGAISLGSILIVLSKDFKEASKISDNGAWVAIVAMVAAVMSITYSLYVLAEQPWTGLLAGAVSLGTVLLAMAQTFKMISNMGDISIDKIGLFLLATTSLLPIGAALYSLSNQPWDGMLAAAAALSATILAMAGAFAIVSGTTPDLAAIATFLAASVSVDLIAAAIYKLADKPWQDLLGAAASLSLVLLAMAGTMEICSMAGATSVAALVGIGLLDVFIANFTLVLLALNKMFESEGARSLLSGGADILIQIGQAISSFVGSIVNGILTGVSSSLPKIAEDLSEFMDNLQPFINGSKNIDAGALAGVGFLAGIIVALTAAEIIQGIASLFKLSIVDMAIELSDFMDELQPFIAHSKDLNADTMKACGYLAGIIVALTAAELIAGVSKFLGLSGSIADFGKELSEFGPYIKDFADEVKDVKKESVEGAAAAAQIMAEVANKLPGTDGLVQKIFGDKSLSEFGEELVKFGPSIKEFGEMVKDVNPESVQGAASAAEIMANLANKLPGANGLVQKIFGDKSLSEFGEELDEFGPYIKDFADEVKDVNAESVQGAAAAAEIMAELANKLPSSDSLWDKIFGGGNVTLSEFGEELVKFGESMVNFSKTAANIDITQINNAIDSFKNLADLAVYIQTVPSSSLSNFANLLGQIGVDSVDNFVQAFSDAEPKVVKAINALCYTIMSTLTSDLSTIQNSGVEVGNAICNGLQSGITDNQQKVIAAEIALVTNMSNALQASLSNDKTKQFGQNLVSGIISGIESKKALTLTTIKNLCTAAINQFKSDLPQQTFRTYGLNIVQWFIDGIESKKALTLTTIKNLCTAAINQFRSSLPQQTFRTYGLNMIQWVIDGIEAKKPSMMATIQNFCTLVIAKFTAELPINTFKNIGHRLVTWISDGIDEQRVEAQNAASRTCTAIIDSFKDNLSQEKFKEIGQNAALGLRYGIEDKVDEIADSAIRAARKAVESAKEALDEHSPSKVMREVGEFFSIGLANGIVDRLKAIAVAGTRAANEAVNPVKTAFDGVSAVFESEDINVEPVIRPVVDLSDVERGAREISNLMNQTYDLSSIYERALSASSSFSRDNESNTGGSQSKDYGSGETKYEFNQYNYSPKALSRSEIYRQTNNQFSAFRRAVNPE